MSKFGLDIKFKNPSKSIMKCIVHRKISIVWLLFIFNHPFEQVRLVARDAVAVVVRVTRQMSPEVEEAVELHQH